MLFQGMVIFLPISIFFKILSERERSITYLKISCIIAYLPIRFFTVNSWITYDVVCVSKGSALNRPSSECGNCTPCVDVVTE